VYKDPKTGNKLGIVNPALSLGVAVHEVLEGLGDFPAETRMSRDLIATYDEVWQKVTGKQGGFLGAEQEKEYYERGKKMLENVIKNPGPLLRKRIKLPEGTMLPNFILSEENNLILCGRVDWIEYKEDDSLRIIDFKTGKNEEKGGSLQLPIYLLLSKELQKRFVTQASYWYLDREEGLVDVELPDIEESYVKVLETALRVKEARESGIYVCPQGEGGCYDCRPYEAILTGDISVEFVGKGEFKQDKYLYNPDANNSTPL
jgi:hypothetical protein